MRRIVIMLFTVVIISGTCYADDGDIIDENVVEAAVPESVDAVLGENPEIENADTDGMLSKLISAFKAEIEKVYKPAIKRGVLIVLIAIICSVFEIFGNEGSPLYLRLCGCVGISTLCIGDFGAYIEIGGEALNNISDFANALLPTLCAAGIACGTPAAAAAKYAASALFMDIFIEVSNSIILPMIYAYTALTVANSAFGGKLTEGMCRMFKWLCTSLMIVLTLAFTAYLSVSSAIASSGDAVVLKTTKAAISMVLPVVGSIISDASSSVIAGAEALRGAVGVFGLLIVIAICITPFAVLGINFLILKAAGAVAGSFNREASTLISGIGSSFGMILSMVGSTGIMLFISIMSCIKAVSA